MTTGWLTGGLRLPTLDTGTLSLSGAALALSGQTSSSQTPNSKSDLRLVQLQALLITRSLLTNKASQLIGRGESLWTCSSTSKCLAPAGSLARPQTVKPSILTPSTLLSFTEATSTAWKCMARQESFSQRSRLKINCRKWSAWLLQSPPLELASSPRCQETFGRPTTLSLPKLLPPMQRRSKLWSLPFSPSPLILLPISWTPTMILRGQLSYHSMVEDLAMLVLIGGMTSASSCMWPSLVSVV